MLYKWEVEKVVGFGAPGGGHAENSEVGVPHLSFASVNLFSSMPVTPP